MRTQLTLAVLGFALAMSGCATSGQNGQSATASSGTAKTNCAGLTDLDDQVADLYAPGKIEKVEPIRRQVFIARAIQPRQVAGANLYVPAEPGMNPAYMERALTCHALGRTGSKVHPNDPLRVAGVKDVDVKAVGSNLRIAITGDDQAAGKAILQQARAVLAGSGDVRVEQLSENPLAPARL